MILISLIRFVGLKRKRLSRQRLLLLSSTKFLWNIGEFGAKKYFTDYRKANLIQLLVAIRGNVSCLLLVSYFSEQVAANGNFPKTT